MNVVQTGGVYQIYGDGLEAYPKLPAKVYDVGFSKMTGFFLTVHHDLTVNEEKIYGNYQRKVSKVLRGFEVASRNFGIILSGPKGVGKSLFAKILSNDAIKKDLPVIIVSDYIPGVSKFISSIDQEVVVIFDEFEKTFAKTDDANPQTEMLSLFDGLDTGKKLFVVTCNAISEVSDYMLNRPGRFHYHFIMDVPDADEIRDYLTDKLDPKYHDTIDKVINFSVMGKITYDCLRAIAFELNLGYSLEETLEDLNISRDDSARFDIVVELNDGTEIIEYGMSIDIGNSKPFGRWFHVRDGGCNRDVWYSFYPSKAKLTKNNDLIVSEVFDVHLDDMDWSSDEQKKKEMFKEKMFAVKRIRLVRQTFDNFKYAV